MNNLNKRLKEIQKLEEEKRRIVSNYDKESHLELLKRSKESKSLSINSREEAFKLSCYSTVLETQLNWETREQFLQLQKNLLENKIGIGKFCQAFSERNVLNSEAASMLESNFILLSPHKKSSDFSKLIYEVLDACYGYDPDPESLEMHNRGKKEFLDFVQKIYRQQQNLLKIEEFLPTQEQKVEIISRQPEAENKIRQIFLLSLTFLLLLVLLRIY